MNNPDALTLSVVVPVFNEEENLSEFVRRTAAVLEKLPNPSELILVDDGSADASGRMIEAAVASQPGLVRGVFFNRNYGQHMAVMAGMAEARGDVVVTIDADLQNPPEEIPRLLAKAAEGFDVVGSVRRKRQDPFFRRFCSRLINRITARATGVTMSDYGCMLRAYRRPVGDAVLACSERSTFIPVLANSFASSTAEIEVGHSEREAGKSKYNVLKLINLQFDLLVGMTTFPLRLLSMIGVLISLAGLGFGLGLIVLRLIYGPDWAAQGVFTLFAVLFIFVGAQFIGLGLIGEYLGRVYQDVRARPRFFVARRIGRGALPQRSSAGAARGAKP